MLRSTSFVLVFLAMTQSTITILAILPFTGDKMQLPIKATFPFSIENPWVFGLVYIYQIFGISMCAYINVSSDTLSSAMIAQINGQVKRLGIKISKIGHEYQTGKIEKEKRLYGEVIKCVKFHEEILR